MAAAPPAFSGDSDEPLINSCPSCGQRIDVTELEPYSKIICQSCRETIRVRTNFHHFTIKEQIGVGGMSRVFRATDTALKRDVALKILNRHCSSDERRVSQFEHEARITAAISHPNVVKVYSSGWDQGYFYIAMELVRGGSLDELIRKNKRVPEARVLDVAIATAHGLKAAQAVGLIHRDIKPGNILFADDGTAKIVDFGLALMLKAVPTADQELWATPYYVPPEKLNGGTEDHRSDLYSLGASLFHAVLGRPPCATDTNSLEELRAIKSQTINLEDEDALLVSQETANLLECALQKSPEDRYVTYEDFIKHAEFALQTVRKGGGGKWRRRKKWSKPVLAAAVLAVAGLGGGLTAWLKPPPPVVTAEQGLQIVSDPTLSESKTVSQEFTLARDALLRGELPEAQEAFAELAQIAPEPTANWSIFNAGLCALLQNDEPTARAAFAELKGSGDGLGRFFTKVSSMMNSPRLIGAAEVQDLDANGYDSMGLLAAGLKNWELGEWRGAAVMLGKFNDGQPSGAARWVQQYHALVAPHLADLRLLQGWPKAEAATLEQGQTNYAKMQRAAAQLRLPGAVKAAAEQELKTLAEKLATLSHKAQDALAEQGKALGKEEAAALQKAQQEAEAAAVDCKFTAAMARLQAEHFQTPEVKEWCAAQVTLWQSAEDFLVQLGKDLLAGGGEREIVRADGTVQKGKITSAGREGIHFSVAGSSGEVTLSFGQISAAELLRWAEQPLDEEKVADADEYYRRRELIVAFALRAQQREFGTLRGNELAREHRAFNERWQRLQPTLTTP